MAVTSVWESLQRKDFVNLLSARDPQDLLDLRAKMEFLVEMVILGPQEHLVLGELLEIQEQMVILVPLAKMEMMESLVIEVHKGHPAKMEREETQELWEFLVLKVLLEPQVLEEDSEIRAQKNLQDLLGKLGLLEQMVQMAHLDQLVHLALMVHQEFKVPWDLLDPKDFKEKLA